MADHYCVHGERFACAEFHLLRDGVVFNGVVFAATAPLYELYIARARARVCVCVCERERERESE